MYCELVCLSHIFVPQLWPQVIKHTSHVTLHNGHRMFVLYNTIIKGLSRFFERLESSTPLKVETFSIYRRMIR